MRGRAPGQLLAERVRVAISLAMTRPLHPLPMTTTSVDLRRFNAMSSYPRYLQRKMRSEISKRHDQPSENIPI